MLSSGQGIDLGEHQQYLQSIESNLDIEIISQTLTRCNRKGLGGPPHRNCQSRVVQKDKLPTRLIDVGEHRVWPCLPRVVESATLAVEAPSQQLRYIAPSHNWGELSADAQAIMTTTRENLQGRMNAIEMQHLPSKYQAGILICRALRVRYLWIGSLCIIQVR